MAVLDTNTGIEQQATREGRFFDRRAIDLEALDTLRQSIVVLSDFLSQSRSEIDRTLEPEQVILEEHTREYIDKIKSATSLFRIAFPKQYTLRSEAYNNLLDSYSSGEDGEMHVVEFSGVQLNAVNLVFLGSENESQGQPAIDARITTPYDQPVHTFDIGGMQELPSLGRWYRFPLQDVRIDLYDHLG